jgi:hypothetical protein
MAQIWGWKIKADRARLRAFGADAMTGRLFGVLRHQAFELGFGLFVLEMRLPGSREDRREFRPGIGRCHVDNPHRFEPRLGWIDAKQPGLFAALDTAPELALGGDNQMLIERIGMGEDLDPFADRR